MSNRLNVVVSIGDLRGVGLEVLIKALSPSNLSFNIILVGCKKIEEIINKAFPSHNLHIKYIKESTHIDDLSPDILHILPIDYQTSNPLNEENSQKIALYSLNKAIELVHNNICKYMITLPLSKSSINILDKDFMGHTEYLARCSNTQYVVMSFYQRERILGLVSTHLPLKEVSDNINIDNIVNTIENVNHFYLTIYNKHPRCAVLSLNPHSSDEGLMGDEEERVIKPAIDKTSGGGVEIDGPFPSDAFFSRKFYEKYDTIIAMYHDQGLIPIKMLGPSVNVTLGLPYLRFSPDHGPAFNIAYKNKADPSSMIETLHLIEKIIDDDK